MEPSGDRQVTQPTFTPAQEKLLRDEMLDLIGKNRTRKKRREALRKLLNALRGLLKILTLAAVLWLLRGWFFMLSVDLSHTFWVPQLPGIGYWWSVLIINLVGVALYRPGWKSDKSKSKEPA
jgi:hypothetical protein